MLNKSKGQAKEKKREKENSVDEGAVGAKLSRNGVLQISDRGFDVRAAVKQIQLMVIAGLEPGTNGLQVRRVNHSSRLPGATIDITPSVLSMNE